MSKPTEPNQVHELPLKTMDYTGAVEGSLACLQLSLAYKNKLERPIEPVFTFPLPPEASVLGVEVQVAGRNIKAELKKRDEAQRDYQQAVAAGHQATMLEQERDNIFTMSVGGIAPGESI